MKKILAFVLCGVMTAGLLGGCGTSSSAEQTTGTAAGTTEQAAGTSEQAASDGTMTTIKIWHDGDEAIMSAIADEVNSELKGDNIQVSFEKKTGLTDQLKLYGTDAQNGPDMYMYAHDSLGTFAEMGILAPITDFISSTDEGIWFQ